VVRAALIECGAQDSALKDTSSAAADGNGTASSTAAGEEAVHPAPPNVNSGGPAPRQLTAADVQFAVAFTRILSVLMKSNPYRNMPLHQIEGLVVPAIMTGQFALMDASINGHPTPVAVAFWAHLSPEVDQRLSDTSVQTPTLRPNEWRSGDILWLLDVVGSANAAQQLLGRLKDEAFVGCAVKLRSRSGEERPKIQLV
jgi:cytolysin-activating lysine-acyltransferase